METIEVNLIRMFMEGPEVSLNGSPTVSPVTDALWASDPLYSITPLIITPASNDFLALSQAPPALFWNIPINTPDTVIPANRPPSISADEVSINTFLNPKPTITGANNAIAPGRIISRIEALVEISIHFSYSGVAVPSIIPGISLNWRRTSCTISIAARPTAAMVSDEKINGIIPPTNSIAKTGALYISIESIPETPTKAAKSARTVSAADAIANPFPVAAVVFPTESRLSVLSLTSSGSPLISAIPPALSAIGPKPSIASCIAVVAIIPAAAIATP